MLTPENDSVVVPPIPAPRKNKRIIHGKLTILDLFIILPMLVILLVIIFVCKLEVWELIVIGICIAFITGFLCWPLGFLGKDKAYIFVIRGLKFVLGSHRNLVTEPEFNDINDEKTTNVKPKLAEKNEDKMSKLEQHISKELLSRIFAKKNKDKNNHGK